MGKSQITDDYVPPTGIASYGIRRRLEAIIPHYLFLVTSEILDENTKPLRQRRSELRLEG